MNDDPRFEQRLTDVMSEPMPTQLRTDLDRHIATLLVAQPVARPTARRLGLPHGPLRRSLLLVAAMFVVAPTLYAASAAMRSTEAPYGMSGAAEIDAELAQTKMVTPIPPGATWPPYLNHASDRGAQYGRGAGRQMVQYTASCMWEGYWLAGHDKGDVAQTSSALGGFEKTRTWRTFTDPFASDQGFHARHQQLVDAAEVGDADPVRQDYAINCTGVGGSAAP